MRKKAIVIGALSALVAGAALMYHSSYAYQGDPAVKGPNYSPERHEAMLKAFENNDYASWKNLKNGRGRTAQVINEENFNRFAQMRKLMLEGKTEEANQIRQELGLGTPGGRGMHRGNGNCLNNTNQ